MADTQHRADMERQLRDNLPTSGGFNTPAGQTVAPEPEQPTSGESFVEKVRQKFEGVNPNTHQGSTGTTGESVSQNIQGQPQSDTSAPSHPSDQPGVVQKTQEAASGIGQNIQDTTQSAADYAKETVESGKQRAYDIKESVKDTLNRGTQDMEERGGAKQGESQGEPTLFGGSAGATKTTERQGPSLTERAGETLEEAKHKAGGTLEEAKRKAGETVQQTRDKAGEKIEQAGESVKPSEQGSHSSATDKASATAQQAKDTANEKLESGKESVRSASDTAGQKASDAAQTARDKTSEVTDSAKDKLNQGAEQTGLSSEEPSVAEKIGKSARDAMDYAKGMLQQGKETVTGAGEQASQKASDTTEGTRNAAGETLASGRDTAQSAGEKGAETLEHARQHVQEPSSTTTSENPSQPGIGARMQGTLESIRETLNIGGNEKSS